MTDKVLKTISEHQMIVDDFVVGVGLSGGADSVALTHILATNREKLGIKKLFAVHIHHGIRGAEADRDLEFSKEFCKRIGIDFIEYKVNIPEEASKTGESLEECARRKRYELFSLTECDAFATAHNLNDNVETVIMNLTRGASLQGICGIPYKRDKYIRPLLDTTREEIEEYLKTNNLEFITDSTNLTDDYTRNRIRHNVLPVLFSVNSSFDKAFLKYLDSVSTSNDFIVEEAKKILQKSRCADGFDCAQIKNCHVALKKQVIALILKEKKANNISREHILAVDNIIKKGGSTNIGNGIVITVERDLLYFGNVKITEDFSFEIQKESQTIKTPVGDVKFDVLLKEDLQKLNNKTTQNLIDYDKLSDRFFLRNRRDGDKYCPKNRNVTKTLKKLFNEEKIPVSKRSQMLILTDDREIVWTEYFGVSEKYKITNQTKKYLQIKNVGE